MELSARCLVASHGRQNLHCPVGKDLICVGLRSIAFVPCATFGCIPNAIQGMQSHTQADQLRHLTKYFATMMDLQGAPQIEQSQYTAVT